MTQVLQELPSAVDAANERGTCEGPGRGRRRGARNTGNHNPKAQYGAAGYGASGTRCQQQSTKGNVGKKSGKVLNTPVTANFGVQRMDMCMELRKLESFLGDWADSLGNRVNVFSADAYQMKLMVTLSNPPRKDIHLQIWPVEFGGGWMCGNSILEPFWSSETELHWVTKDGRVSVWVRPQDRSRSSTEDTSIPAQATETSATDAAAEESTEPAHDGAGTDGGEQTPNDA